MNPDTPNQTQPEAQKPNVPVLYRFRKLIGGAFASAMHSIFHTSPQTKKKPQKLEGPEFYQKVRETQLAHELSEGVEVAVMSGTITETHPEGLRITNNPIYIEKAEILGDVNPLIFPRNYWFYSIHQGAVGQVVVEEIDLGRNKLPVKLDGSGHTSGGFVSWKGKVIAKNDGKYGLDVTKDNPEATVEETMPDVGYTYFLDNTN